MVDDQNEIKKLVQFIKNKFEVQNKENEDLQSSIPNIWQ